MLAFCETADFHKAGETTAIGDQTQPIQIQIHSLLGNLVHIKYGAMTFP